MNDFAPRFRHNSFFTLVRGFRPGLFCCFSLFYAFGGSWASPSPFSDFFRNLRGPLLASACIPGNWDTNDSVSLDQWPPTSISTTNLARERGPTSSRHVRSLGRLAACKTTPSASAAAPCGDPSQWRARVVPTANWQPSTVGGHHDLQSVVVRHIKHCQVHVPNQHICPHTSANFTANAPQIPFAPEPQTTRAT